MSKIFITGSADGLGFLSAQALIKNGHTVIFHARNEKRKADLLKKIPEARVLIADLADQQAVKALANEVNQIGKMDAVIHNAGVYQVSRAEIFKINTIAPYLLTCLITKPDRIIYLTSGMHLQGSSNFSDLSNTRQCSYSDSKLHDVIFCTTVARLWPDVYVNCVNPGWVPTKMGGKGAPDNLQKGYETQVWLSVSDDPEAKVSGQYFHHQKIRTPHPDALDPEVQKNLFEVCEEMTGIKFPVN